jgi:hypothetical protein
MRTFGEQQQNPDQPLGQIAAVGFFALRIYRFPGFAHGGILSIRFNWLWLGYATERFGAIAGVVKPRLSVTLSGFG